MTRSKKDNRAETKRVERDTRKMVRWFESKDYYVVFERGIQSQLNPHGEVGVVWIDTSKVPKSMLYIMLHEAGHLILSKRKSYAAKFASGYPLTIEEGTRANRKLKRNFHKIGVVHEELEAWEAGKKLARRLKIEIDPKAWQRIMTWSITRYFGWALDPRSSMI